MPDLCLCPIYALLSHCRVYHFHDTSPAARVRQYCYLGDNRWLMPDAGNLAALLLRLRDEHGGAVYQRIVTTIRLVAPFFHDFDLEPAGPNKKDIILNWRDKGSDAVFGPHQLSDGTLRAVCLVTLLMQSENELPDLIIVDEPELGLHPYALNVVAALFKKASHHTQVIISTQSSFFLDNFDPEDVVVVNREGKESQFTRPDGCKTGGVARRVQPWRSLGEECHRWGTALMLHGTPNTWRILVCHPTRTARQPALCLRQPAGNRLEAAV